jgi:plasmid maintenance system antidote protein VapI
MRLSKIAILAVKGASPAIVKKLAEAIEVSEPSVYRFINDNDDNLTKAAAIKVIELETGLTREQILEEEQAQPATAK